MQPQFFNIINDELRGSEKTHAVTDPRIEEDLWPCPIATNQDFEDAVDAAQKAFVGWSKSTVPERQALLVKLAENLEEHEGELSAILAKETGKSLAMAGIDLKGAIAQCLYYSKTALEDEIQYEDAHTKVVATHVPLGVVCAICPWNFPIILSNIKVVSSLITGNCIIVKPSPFTPYAVLKWIELARGILPPGVLQVLNGGADLGALMTLHPGVAKISFTGTTATGKRVMAACAKTLKRVTLELAGNDACVVCADADLDKTVPSVAAGAFFNAGQVCVASKRVYVHESIYDEFLGRLVKEVQNSYAIAEDAAKPSMFGPLSNKLQFDVVKGIFDDCRKNGFEFALGGGDVGANESGPKKGLWLPPTIVKRPPEDCLLVKEEQFGPILPVLSYADEDDVIARSNLANAGLGASVYSRNLAQAERIARRLEAGSVWINQFERPNFGAFFGGIKDSGFGGEMGKQGLLSYADTKCLHFGKAF